MKALYDSVGMSERDVGHGWILLGLAALLAVLLLVVICTAEVAASA